MNKNTNPTDLIQTSYGEFAAWHIELTTYRAKRVRRFVLASDKWFAACRALRMAEGTEDKALIGAAVDAWGRTRMPSKSSKARAYNDAWYIAELTGSERARTLDDLRRVSDSWLATKGS